jgi:hypothetical protein
VFESSHFCSGSLCRGAETVSVIPYQRRNRFGVPVIH